jgi:hypothetical protein
VVRHTSKLNYTSRIIVITIHCDSIYRHLLPLHVSVSWPSSEGVRSTCSGTTIAYIFKKFLYKKLFIIIWIKFLLIWSPQRSSKWRPHFLACYGFVSLWYLVVSFCCVLRHSTVFLRQYPRKFRFIGQNTINCL